MDNLMTVLIGIVVFGALIAWFGLGMAYIYTFFKLLFSSIVSQFKRKDR